MKELILKFRNINSNPDLVTPFYATEFSSGMDVCAHLSDSVVLSPRSRVLIQTGLSFEIPLGYEIQIRPRSGLALKHGITVLNTPATIDADYRGEIKILLINLGEEDFVINNKDKIAQLVITSVERAVLEQSESLQETERGAGGFGSTGSRPKL